MSLVESPPVVPLLGAAALPSIWTDTRIAELTRMWEFEAMSAAQIARALGCFAHCVDGGRSAVIGKVHRLDLKPRTSPIRKVETRSTKGQPRRRYGIPKFLPNRAAKPKEKPVTAVSPVPEISIPLSQRCSLLELDKTKCHWPIGDPGAPDFRFCGGMAVDREPYCRGHMQIAYTPYARAKPKGDRTETGWG